MVSCGVFSRWDHRAELIIDQDKSGGDTVAPLSTEHEKQFVVGKGWIGNEFPMLGQLHPFLKYDPSENADRCLLKRGEDVDRGWDGFDFCDLYQLGSDFLKVRSVELAVLASYVGTWRKEQVIRDVVVVPVFHHESV